MNKFEMDLVKGQEGEKFVENYYKSLGKDVVVPIGYCKEYDMIVNEMKIEVKYDRDPAQLRNDFNVVLEMYCNKKESGVLATGSSVYFYIYHLIEQCYALNVNELKKYLVHRKEQEDRWKRYIAETPGTDIDFDREFNLPGIYKTFDNSDGKDSSVKAKGYIIPMSHLVEIGIAKRHPSLEKFIWG